MQIVKSLRLWAAFFGVLGLFCFVVGNPYAGTNMVITVVLLVGAIIISVNKEDVNHDHD